MILKQSLLFIRIDIEITLWGKKKFSKITQFIITRYFVTLLKTRRCTQHLHIILFKTQIRFVDNFIPLIWRVISQHCFESPPSWFIPLPEQPTVCKVLVRLLWFILDLRCAETLYLTLGVEQSNRRRHSLCTSAWSVVHRYTSEALKIMVKSNIVHTAKL